MRIYNLSDITGRNPCSSYHYPCPPCPCPSCPCLPCSMSIAHSTFNLNNSADTEVALQELKSSKAHTGRARRPQRKIKLFFQSLAMTNCDSGYRNIWKCGEKKYVEGNPNELVSGRAAGNFPRVFYFPDRRAITWLICLQVWIRPPGYFQSFNPIVNVLLCSARSSLRNELFRFHSAKHQCRARHSRSLL